ncbi:unnamed protein product [Echinostoma caproni]|uniref:Myb-like domain-containing protein n=1 Tax=Echinostoma caproni TaxID=27848 RepID=A0A183AQH9_9TREM|nr:unnamed protein product [Echinostoma caproni]
MERNTNQQAPLLIHPSDKNKIRRFFGSGSAADPERLQRAEIDLLRASYPQLACLWNDKLMNRSFCASGSMVSFDSKRPHQRFSNARYQQLLYFAEKHGISEEAARGILRTGRSSSSGQVSRTSRCPSAVTFKLPSEVNAGDSEERITDQSTMSQDQQANELWSILERIQIEHSTPSRVTNSSLKNETEREPLKVDNTLFSRQINEKLVNDFSDWCVEEQMTADVMLQRIHANHYGLPRLKVIPRKTDGGFLVKVDQSFNRKLRSAHQTWSSWFHVVPVGFRAYLQLVEGEIKAWTKQQEAIYQANQLSAELERAMKNADQPAEDPIKETKHPLRRDTRSKSKINTEVSRSPSSLENQGTLIGDSEQFIVPGSLKALKREQEQALLARQETERNLGDKRARSAKRRGDANAADKSKTKKESSSASPNSGARQKHVKGHSIADGDSKSASDLTSGDGSKETFWPFVGYDVDNVVPHWTGEITHLFPTDGGTIRTERSELPNGESMLRVSLLKDGHVFTVHRIDPPTDPSDQDTDKLVENLHNENEVRAPVNDDDGSGQAEEHVATEDQGQPEEQEPDANKVISTDDIPSYYSSCTAQFSDGLQLTVAHSTQTLKLPWALTDVKEAKKENNAQQLIKDPQSTQKSNLTKDVNEPEAPSQPPPIEDTTKVDSNNEARVLQSMLATLPDGAQLTFLHMEHTEVLTYTSETGLETLGTSELTVHCSANPTQSNHYASFQNSRKSTALTMNKSVTVQSMILRMRAADAYRSTEAEEMEVERYLLANGSLVLIMKTKQKKETRIGIKILLPNGDRMERDTLVADQLYHSEQPRFPSDVSPEEEPQVTTGCMDVPAVGNSRRTSVAQSKSRVPGKSARKKAEEQKSESYLKSSQVSSSFTHPDMCNFSNYSIVVESNFQNHYIMKLKEVRCLPMKQAVAQFCGNFVLVYK